MKNQLIKKDSTAIKFEGIKGTWSVIDTEVTATGNIYLLESDIWGMKPLA